MITVDNIVVSVKSSTLLCNVSCLLKKGRSTSFIGSSGAGKTTLLKALAGLMPIDKGHIHIDGTELASLTPRQRSETVGYVFQEFNLFPHQTVLENCTDPLLVYGLPLLQAKKRALSVLHDLGMNDHINQYPSELSGGQQQRTAIARALCLKPSVLLLDEPTASLDPFNTNRLITILQKLVHNGLTIALSSQDINFINKIFDRVYYLENGTIVEFCDTMQSIKQAPAISRFIHCGTISNEYTQSQ
jgi:ABC-type polar amino acid transport system ATPase subunit